MGQVGGVRFCDACGRTMSEGERLVRSGEAWVCGQCGEEAEPLPMAIDAVAPRPASALPVARGVPVRSTRLAWSRLGALGIVLGLSGGLIGFFLDPTIGTVGAALGTLFGIVGLIWSLALRRESAHLPAAALLISLLAWGFIGASERDQQLLLKTRSEHDAIDRENARWTEQLHNQP